MTAPPEQLNRITPETDEPTDIGRGDRMSFLARTGFGGPITVLRVTWIDPDDTDRHKDWRLVRGVATAL